MLRKVAPSKSVSTRYRSSFFFSPSWIAARPSTTVVLLMIRMKVLTAVSGILRIWFASAGLRAFICRKRSDQRREKHDLGGQEDPHAQLAIVQPGAGVSWVDEFAHDDLWCWLAGKLEATS